MRIRSEADRASARATLYGALALGFRAPTEETVRRLAGAEDAALLARAGDVAGVAEAHALRGRARETEELDAVHRALFGHTARGEVPPYETEWGAEALFQQPQELADLAGFLRAFGLVPRPEVHERVDHVSTECEFLCFLGLKEAYAEDAGDADLAETTRRAASLFLRDHLGRFAPVFVRRLERSDPSGFYATLGRLLRALVAADAARLGVPLGSEGLGLRPDPAACSAPMGCDAGSGCPALESGEGG